MPMIFGVQTTVHFLNEKRFSLLKRGRFGDLSQPTPHSLGKVRR